MVTLSIDWASQSLTLLPEFAVHWPAASCLIIADPHFGKDSSFRSFGIPIPPGTTGKDLATLTFLIERTNSERMIILGDFFHSKSSRQQNTMNQLLQWRTRHQNLEIVNIRGNHDIHSGDPPPVWNIRVEQEPWRFDGLTFRHRPDEGVEVYSLCGHLHPAVRLLERAGPRVVLPCFWMSGKKLVLPSFGAFTGNSMIAPGKGDRVFVVADGDVLEAPLRK